MKSCTFESKPVVNEPYSFDTLIIDDTVSTNIHGLLLEVLFTVDSENKTQIVGFCLLEDKTQGSLTRFLSFVKHHMQYYPRVIILLLVFDDIVESLNRCDELVELLKAIE